MNQNELEQLVHALAMVETDAAKRIAEAEQASEKRLRELNKQLEKKAEQEIQKLVKELAKDREKRLQGLNREVERRKRNTTCLIENMRMAQEGAIHEIVDWAVARIKAL